MRPDPFNLSPGNNLLMTCPSCNASRDAAARFCPECGAAMKPSEDSPAVVAAPVSSSLSTTEDGRFGPGSSSRNATASWAHWVRAAWAKSIAPRTSSLTSPSFEVPARERLAQSALARTLPRRSPHRTPGAAPNVCHVYDIGEVDGSALISMEYADGETSAASCAASAAYRMRDSAPPGNFNQ